MSDIVERLRSSSPYLHGSSAEDTMAEAADGIERLRVKVERLRALSQNNAHSWDAIVRERDGLRAEGERLRLRVKFLEDELKCAEPKP